MSVTKTETAAPDVPQAPPQVERAPHQGDAFPYPPTDLLESDGEPLESDWHVRTINLMCEMITHHFLGREDYYVGGNMFIYFNQEQARNLDYRGPDFFFVDGDVSRTPLRPYWAIWNEKGRYPDVIIELLSPTTKKEDLTTKKHLYEKTFGTDEYYCYDPGTQELIGWRLMGTYQQIVPNEKGWLWSEQLGLWVGKWYGPFLGYSMVWLRFFDKEGNVVPTFGEAAQARADAEQQRADAEQQHAAMEQQRADAERQRADAAKQRADALEAELARLESPAGTPNEPANMSDDPKRYLEPLTLAKVRSLELKARLIVEGYLSGMHKSPYHGFSVEFAQHREYVPGDDIRHVDWKVYGRTGKFFLKQYEEETNLVCWILLDISESMHYGSKDGMTKYDYACLAAAALAYLVLHQADSVGFVTFDTQVRAFMKPSSQPSHLKEMITCMNQGAGREKSRMAPLFHDLAERVNRRALIFLLSDMFDEVPDILAGFKHLRHKRHEVVLWHILDVAELTFPFQEATLFRGLEQYPELLTDPRSLRASYLEQIESFVKELQRGCRDQNIDYVSLRTDTPLNVAFSSYLTRRLTRSK